ncbi:hypothetical protein Agub_g5835, partial [Astrephomene gubernaculifera]
TSCEIAGGDVLPHACIGSSRRLLVGHRSRLASVMLEAVQNHGPQVLVVDEIGNAEEVSAARTISQRGVLLVATAHGTDLGSLLRNNELNNLVGGLQSVTLGDGTAARSNGGAKVRTERRGAPTFRTLVEVMGGGRLRVRPDVAASVDALLGTSPTSPCALPPPASPSALATASPAQQHAGMWHHGHHGHHGPRGWQHLHPHSRHHSAASHHLHHHPHHHP